MPLSITHGYVSTVAEAPGSGVPGGRVGPNEWNAPHVISGSIDPSNIGAGGPAGAIQYNNNGILDGAVPTAWDNVNQLFSIGTNTNVDILGNGTLQVANNGQPWNLSLVNYHVANFPEATLQFATTRGGSPTTHGALQANDFLGAMYMYGSTGSDWSQGGSLVCAAAAGWSPSSTPTTWIFRTNPIGSAGTNVEAVRIDNNQCSTFGGGPNIDTLGRSTIQSVNNGQPWNLTLLTYSNGTFVEPTLQFAATRGSGPAVQSALQTGDFPVAIYGYGSNGSAWQEGGLLACVVDGNWSGSNNPTRWSFAHCLAGSATNPHEYVRFGQNTNGASISIWATGQSTATGNLNNRPMEVVTVNQQAWYCANVFANDNSNFTAFLGRKSRGAFNTQIASVAGDTILVIASQGSDGSNYQPNAGIVFYCDATPNPGNVPGRIALQTSSATTQIVEAIRIDSAQNVAIGTGAGAIPTNSINGFFYINTMAGNPSGTPSPPNALTGLVPMIYDTTNNRLWVRNAGTWRSVLLS